MNNNPRITPNLPLWSFQLQSDSKLVLKSRKDLEFHLITRTLKDENFRRAFVSNPKEVIENELGNKLPEALEINILQETEDTLYMVLPCNPYEGLSEEELKASLGMTYEDVAQWVLEQQRNAFLDEESTIKILGRAWKEEIFKQELIRDPIKTIQDIQEIEIQDIKIQVLEELTNTVFIVLPKSFAAFESTSNPAELHKINMPTVIGSGALTSGIDLCQTLRACNPPGCPGLGTFCIFTLF